MLELISLAQDKVTSSMMKQIAAFCLVSIVLQPLAWGHEDVKTTKPEHDASAKDGDIITGKLDADRLSKKHSALEGVYVGAATGPVFYRDNSIDGFDLDFYSGGQLTVLAGKRLGPLRAEFEIANQGAEFDPSNSRFDGDIYIGRFTVSAYLDVTNVDVSWIKGGITPYLGGGAGVAVADVEGFDDDDTGFTAHGEAGFSFPIHKRIEIVPAYRFEWADFDDFDRNHKAHTIRVGGRYSF